MHHWRFAKSSSVWAGPQISKRTSHYCNFIHSLMTLRLSSSTWSCDCMKESSSCQNRSHPCPHESWIKIATFCTKCVCVICKSWKQQFFPFYVFLVLRPVHNSASDSQSTVHWNCGAQSSAMLLGPTHSKLKLWFKHPSLAPLCRHLPVATPDEMESLTWHALLDDFKKMPRYHTFPGVTSSGQDRWIYKTSSSLWHLPTNWNGL